MASTGSLMVTAFMRTNYNDIQPYIVYYPSLSVGDSVYTNVSVSTRENIGTERNTGINFFNDLQDKINQAIEGSPAKDSMLSFFPVIFSHLISLAKLIPQQKLQLDESRERRRMEQLERASVRLLPIHPCIPSAMVR